MEVSSAITWRYAIRRTLRFTEFTRRGSTRLLVVLLAAGCGSDSTGPGDAQLELHAGYGVTDTAQHKPPQALVADVGYAGRRVHFQSLPVSPDDPTPSMYVSKLDASSFQVEITETSNARGRAAARIQLGTRAGQGGIIVSLPDLGLADTAFYTVLPASPCDLVFESGDTALSLGSTFSLEANVVDRHGNRRPDLVDFQVEGSAVELDPSGIVTAQTLGQAEIIARAAELADTIQIGVVPVATVAASTEETAAFVLRSLDGVEHSYLNVSVGGRYDRRVPDWAPSGDRIMFETENRLYVLDLDGQLERLIVPGYGIVEETWPQYSPDGAWIYFSGNPGQPDDAWELWRVRADGVGPERVGPAAETHRWDLWASPSPDGTEIVYSTGSPYYGWTLQILDLGTGSGRSLDLAGECPRWSPLGDLIAYVNAGVVFVVRPDGTDMHHISPLNRGYQVCIDWSPDGHYVLARANHGIDVIQIETGEAVRLPNSAELHYPSWRP